MKKIILMAAFAVASVAASAQVYVGGGLGFSSDKAAHPEGVEVKAKDTIKILPEVGYKLDDKMAVGIALGFNHSKQGDVKSTGFSVAPYFRYTFVKWNNVGLFADAQFAYENLKDEDVQGGQKVENKTNTWSLGIKPGVSVDLTENVTFLAKVGWLGYRSSKPDGDGMKASSEFGVDADLTNLSFSMLFNF